MTDYPTQNRSFTLTRILAAPRHAVFTAWTDPEHLAWFYNPAMPMPTAPIEVDLRVGGTWRQQMIVNEDLSYPTGGIYLEIVPNERLIFRWGAVGGWPELDGENELTAPVVTVQLNDSGGTQTELVLTVQFSEDLDVDEVRELMQGGTQEGWGATIDRVKDSTAMLPGTAEPATLQERFGKSDAQLLAQLASERGHVLRAVDGLDGQEMSRTLVPSGWTMTQLLNHLAFDDEMFWISAVLGGDDRAIAELHNGWTSTPMTGAEAINIYKREIARSDEVLAKIDLDAPPRWWPPASVFDAPPMSDGREVLFRVLAETSVHAGHLDIVRELIDGHQNLVVE